MFEVLVARPMLERVRQRLRAAGVRGLPRGTRRSTRLHPVGLTDKELAVLELLAAELRNKEIAVRLHRSARTVEHHLAAIFGNLGVATRAEAVSAAYRLGIVAGTRPASADAAVAGARSAIPKAAARVAPLCACTVAHDADLDELSLLANVTHLIVGCLACLFNRQVYGIEIEFA